MANHIPTPASNEDEIDLLALAKTLWENRNIVLKSILICGIIGILVASTSPKEYEASTVMVPSIGGNVSNLAGLGGLAAMAGINLNISSGGDLVPSVYPQIIVSLPYQLELMKTPLSFSGINEPVSLIDYFTEIQKPNLLRKYTIGLPSVLLGISGSILSTIKGPNLNKIVEPNENQKPFELTGKQQSGRNILTGLVSLNVNSQGGTITLTTRMPEALAAAQLCQRAQELLQEQIIEYKIKKTKANLVYIQQRFDETALRFEEIQQKLATFSDRNKNVSLASAKTEEVRLTSQYNLIFSIYSDLAKQLEQAKIQVKQDTPVFTIIEPVTVPTTKSNPNRPKILMISIFLGAFLGTIIVFGLEFIRAIKKMWRNEGHN